MARRATERASRAKRTKASEAWWAGRVHSNLGDEAVLVMLQLASLGALAVWAATWLGA